MNGVVGLLALLAFGLAYVNGANDVSKGIATLVGSGLSDYRRAMLWGTAWTALGGLLSAALATAMVTTFGSGLIAAGTSQSFAAAVATLVGATAWVLIATRSGLPVSTTHAIVGSLIGVAAMAYGVGGVRWSALASKVVMPLLLTPLISLGLVVGLLRLTRRVTGDGVEPAPDCLCADVSLAEPALAGASSASMQRLGVPLLRLSVGAARSCDLEQPRAARLTLDHLHWLTAGATSFARGMNDAPKIVALVIAATALQGASALSPALLFAVVTGGMVTGSLVAGRRVTRVLAENVTPMTHREGLLANLVTAALVTAGATLGLPMSTTHVSSGGIIGAGAQRASLNRNTLRDLSLAWVVTLPAAAALGMGVLWLGRWLA